MMEKKVEMYFVKSLMLINIYKWIKFLNCLKFNIGKNKNYDINTKLLKI